VLGDGFQDVFRVRFQFFPDVYQVHANDL